jgi:hypothetical protein
MPQGRTHRKEGDARILPFASILQQVKVGQIRERIAMLKGAP